MNSKSLLILLAVLCTSGAFSQAKVFRFNEIQCRNKKQQWDKPKKTEDRLVYIDGASIDVTLDKPYHLTILTVTELPNEGAIYLCKDEQQNDITVTLVEDQKMFVYNDTKRFQVNFTQSGFAPSLSAFAEVED